MRAGSKKFFWVAVVALLTSCGEVTTPVAIPTPTPVTPPASDLPPVTDPAVDPRIPDLTKAAPLRLTNPSDYSGLTDLAGVVFAPLVGDPQILLSYNGGRDSQISGKVLIAFEDREGFWGAELPSFAQTGVRSSNAIDMIFSDDSFTIRVAAAISGDNLDGVVYYRLRASTDNACREMVRVCYPGFYCPQPDVNGPCRAYMDTSSSKVKLLGTFRGTYSKWVTP